MSSSTRTRPNKPVAPNPAAAPRSIPARYYRRVGEPRRSALTMNLTLICTTALIVCFISACSPEGESSNGPDAIVVGGLYASKNEDGTFGVSKVLAVDGAAVHVRIYRNKFPSLPQNLDSSVLSLGKLGEPGGFGIGHAPIAKEGWVRTHTFLKKEPVREEELEGYKYYLEAMKK